MLDSRFRNREKKEVARLIQSENRIEQITANLTLGAPQGGPQLGQAPSLGRCMGLRGALAEPEMETSCLLCGTSLAVFIRHRRPLHLAGDAKDWFWARRQRPSSSPGEVPLLQQRQEEC